MIKCNLNMCENNKEGICILKEVTIDKYYDSEYGEFSGGKCTNLKFKQSYIDEKAEETFKLTRISDDVYYAVRTDIYEDVDMEYILNKYPNIKTLITDNAIRQGTKANNRFWIYTFENNDIKSTSVCDKYNEIITKDMLKFTCDYIRNRGSYGCLTSTAYKMIMKGINL